MTEPIYRSLYDWADILGVPFRTLYNACRAGELAHLKAGPGGKIHATREQIESWIERKTVSAK